MEARINREIERLSHDLLMEYRKRPGDVAELIKRCVISGVDIGLVESKRLMMETHNEINEDRERENMPR